jgi:hypothetical protein
MSYIKEEEDTVGGGETCTCQTFAKSQKPFDPIGEIQELRKKKSSKTRPTMAALYQTVLLI